MSKELTSAKLFDLGTTGQQFEVAFWEAEMVGAASGPVSAA